MLGGTWSELSAMVLDGLRTHVSRQSATWGLLKAANVTDETGCPFCEAVALQSLGRAEYVLPARIVWRRTQVNENSINHAAVMLT